MSGCGTPIAPGTAPSAPEPREEGALAAPATLSTSGGRSRGRRRLRRVLALLLLPPLVGVGALILLDRLFPFPIEQLVPASSSALVRSREEVPLLATVARDDQWRIRVPLAAIDPRLIEATVAVEDERFRRHPGVDPLSIARAVGQNLSAGEVVSGASTITMQLCRLLHPRPRTLRSKMIEAFRALQLERLLGKERILEEYLNRAPYGGNLVGVEAAARHYLGRGAGDLSLAEAALLAGLPQGPSILRPDRHPERARRRRDTVLRRMHEEGRITAEERRTAEATPVEVLGRGEEPHGLTSPEPSLAPHASWWALARDPRGMATTLDLTIQRALQAALAAATGVPRGADVAAVVIELETGAVRGMVGGRELEHPDSGWVNAAVARRSPGSTLKPFVYALAFDQERLAPASRVPDRPIERAGWRPRNFDDRWRGEVSVEEALVDSLNVPAILVAEAVGLSGVSRLVERCGIALPAGAQERAGLALVTGALEVSLLDLVAGYATLGRGGVALPPTIDEAEARRRRARAAAGEELGERVLRARTCRELDAILSRGDGGARWWMAKTGTSSRHRDAWAVGHDGRHAVGVWVGRREGGGDPSLVGGEVALPILERILIDAAFRGGAPPSPLGPRSPRRPLAFEVAELPLRIDHPEDGAKWIALEREGVAVTLRAAGGRAPYTWFVDGRLASGSATEETPRASILLPPGEHELRVVDANGAAVFHRCSVRGEPAARR